MSFVYNLIKDIIFFLFKKEHSQETVDFKFPDTLIEKGKVDSNIKFCWSREDRVRQKKDQGYEVYYEKEFRKRISFRTYDGSVLMYKKK